MQINWINPNTGVATSAVCASSSENPMHAKAKCTNLALLLQNPNVQSIKHLPVDSHDGFPRFGVPVLLDQQTNSSSSTLLSDFVQLSSSTLSAHKPHAPLVIYSPWSLFNCFAERMKTCHLSCRLRIVRRPWDLRCSNWRTFTGITSNSFQKSRGVWCVTSPATILAYNISKSSPDGCSSQRPVLKFMLWTCPSIAFCVHRGKNLCLSSNNSPCTYGIWILGVTTYHRYWNLMHLLGRCRALSAYQYHITVSVATPGWTTGRKGPGSSRS